MDTTLALPPKNLGPVAYVPEQLRTKDTKVPPVKALDRSATLPPEKPFVAQVITARLSGTEFPENPGEIAPPERTLRPYSVPMLPYDKDEPEAETPDQTAAAITEPADKAANEVKQLSAPAEAAAPGDEVTPAVAQAPRDDIVPDTTADTAD